MVSHSDHDAALFLPGFDIAVRFRNLFQWIAPIDDRFEVPRLDQVFKEDQKFGGVTGRSMITCLLLLIEVQRPLTMCDSRGWVLPPPSVEAPPAARISSR